MKKTLVALAALSAISAFAQSSVVIDGYIDRAYTMVNNTDNNKDLKSVSSSAGTTTIGIKVREDLGGGVSVGGSVNTDWAELAGNKQGEAGTTQASGFANSQSFLDVTSAQYGTLRLGTPNSFTLTNATSVTSPAFSSAIGSAYSSSFSIANGAGTGTSNKGGIVDVSSDLKNSAGTAVVGASAGQRSVRIANTVQYSSPVFMGGLTAHVGITPKNDNATTVGAIDGKANTVGVKEYALRYTNGPVDAMYTSIKYEIGSNALFVNYVTSNATYKDASSTQNLLGVTYTVMPSLKLHAGMGQFKSTLATIEGKSQSYGVTYTTGAWDILAQMAKVDDTGTNNFDRKLTGLGVNYNLSKTARAYVRYDSINYASNKTAFEGSELKRTAIGVSKAF